MLAAGFERIHRSNLVNTGVLPLRLPDGMHPDAMALRPGDRIEVDAQEFPEGTYGEHLIEIAGMLRFSSV